MHAKGLYKTSHKEVPVCGISSGSPTGLKHGSKREKQKDQEKSEKKRDRAEGKKGGERKNRHYHRQLWYLSPSSPPVSGGRN